MLRSFSDGYDLLRLVIETPKDQMSRMRWNIVPREHVKRQRRADDAKKYADALQQRQRQGQVPGIADPAQGSAVTKADSPPQSDPTDPLEAKIIDIEKFLIRPDKVHFWDEWLRMLLEDLFVI